MKKYILLILVLITLCGCSKERINSYENKNTYKEPVDTYKDSNTTPIGIYSLDGNTLKKLHQINVAPVVEQDIGVFQIYPSREEEIKLSKAFGLAFYDEWIKYPNIKLGLNIKFELNNGDKISYNIFSPENTFERWEYLMNYLYDDYNNYGKSFYSHIENDEFTADTLITSIKLQSSYSIDMVNSKIQLTVFTYDDDNDLIDNEYRGNSSYTLDICLEGRTC